MTPTNRASIGNTNAGAHGMLFRNGVPCTQTQEAGHQVKFLKNENTGKTDASLRIMTIRGAG